jgi:hypothetical protein
MLDIINDFDSKYQDDYRKAAQQFRLPYWDYYRPRRGPGNFPFPGVIDGGKTSYPYDYSVPEILTEERVMVKKSPHNEPDDIKNPLNYFSFKAGKLPDGEWKVFAADVGQERSHGVENKADHSHSHGYSLGIARYAIPPRRSLLETVRG